MNTTRLKTDQIFLIYALTESARAIRQFEEVSRLAAIRESIGPGIERRENQAIFDSIRMALQFSANLSKVFWPAARSAKKIVERGQRLRTLTGIPDEHPLKSRELRNHIEHMDERLDTWTAESPRPFLAVEGVYVDGLAARDIVDSTMVVYRESDNSVYLLGERFDLTATHADVLDVQTKISAAASKALSQS
jgi:hypothetical protein